MSLCNVDTCLEPISYDFVRVAHIQPEIVAIVELNDAPVPPLRLVIQGCNVYHDGNLPV